MILEHYADAKMCVETVRLHYDNLPEDEPPPTGVVWRNGQHSHKCFKMEQTEVNQNDFKTDIGSQKDYWQVCELMEIDRSKLRIIGRKQKSLIEPQTDWYEESN